MEELKSISDIDSKVTAHPNSVIIIYAKGCPWCKQLIKDLKKVENSAPFRVYLLRDTIGAPLVKKLGVEGVPVTLAFVECELQGLFNGYDESIVKRLYELYKDAKNICRVDLSKVLFDSTQLGEPII